MAIFFRGFSENQLSMFYHKKDTQYMQYYIHLLHAPYRMCIPHTPHIGWRLLQCQVSRHCLILRGIPPLQIGFYIWGFVGKCTIIFVSVDIATVRRLIVWWHPLLFEQYYEKRWSPSLTVVVSISFERCWDSLPLRIERVHFASTILRCNWWSGDNCEKIEIVFEMMNFCVMFL